MKYVRNLIPLGTLGLAMYFVFADGVAFGASLCLSRERRSGTLPAPVIRGFLAWN
jgi:hypothetical protein